MTIVLLVSSIDLEAQQTVGEFSRLMASALPVISCRIHDACKGAHASFSSLTSSLTPCAALALLLLLWSCRGCHGRRVHDPLCAGGVVPACPAEQQVRQPGQAEVPLLSALTGQLAAAGSGPFVAAHCSCPQLLRSW